MKAESDEIVRVDGHEIKVTHPGKVLFPGDGITKAQLVRYYIQAGPRMLPYLEGRPLTLQRFPDGIDHPGFIQKASSRYFPDWIPTVTVNKAGGTLRQVVCDNVATLAYLAGQASITPHVWLSQVSRPEFPDQLVFDLDPPTEDTAAVIAGAHLLKEVLDELAMPAFVKSTGSRGLHVAAPLQARDDFDSVRAFARQVAEHVVSMAPEAYTIEPHKNKRRGRVFLDINRNGYAQTVVAAYAVRARRGAPVAIPLRWSDLQERTFRIGGVTLLNIQEHLQEDPWKDFASQAVSLENIRRKMEKLHAA